MKMVKVYIAETKDLKEFDTAKGALLYEAKEDLIEEVKRSGFSCADFSLNKFLMDYARPLWPILKRISESGNQ